MVLTPYVVDKGEDAARSARIASGMSTYPMDALQEGRGFPESFTGWGHEDIALLHVLREQHDVPSVALVDVVATHTPHPPRGGEEQQRSDHVVNLQLYQDIVNQLDAGGEVLAAIDVGTHAVRLELALALLRTKEQRDGRGAHRVAAMHRRLERALRVAPRARRLRVQRQGDACARQRAIP
jgi:hypothetical protein